MRVQIEDLDKQLTQLKSEFSAEHQELKDPKFGRCSVCLLFVCVCVCVCSVLFALLAWCGLLLFVFLGLLWFGFGLLWLLGGCLVSLVFVVSFGYCVCFVGLCCGCVCIVCLSGCPLVGFCFSTSCFIVWLVGTLFYCLIACLLACL